MVYNLGAHENVKAGKEFADMNLHDFDIMTEAAEEKAIEAARNFYANGVSVGIIAKSLNMTVEQVKEIINESSPA